MPSTKKRGGCQGFDEVKGNMMVKRIKLWTKNTVECDWRTVHIEKICYTFIHRTFTYEVNSLEQTFISAFGMKEAVKRKLDSRVKSVRNSLPGGAADALVLPENFDPKDIIIEVTDDGDLGFMELYVITCNKCHMSETGFMQYFVTKYKALLPEDPKLADTMDNWDKITAKHSGEMKHRYFGMYTPPSDAHFCITERTEIYYSSSGTCGL